MNYKLIITTGDTTKFIFALERDGIPINIQDSATVTAGLLTPHTKDLIVLSDTITDMPINSDWSKGIIVASFDTSSIPSNKLGDVVVTIKVDDITIDTWYKEAILTNSGL